MPNGLSQVEMVNIALIEIGDATITSMTENNERARTMNALFNSARDNLIRDCPWNFAMKRATLTASPTAPIYEWATAFPLPADFLYMFSTESDSRYRLEGGNLLSNTENSLNITYVRRVEVVTEFDTGFTDALIAKLAFEASTRFAQDPATTNRLFGEFQLEVIKAKKLDGQEDNPREYAVDDWEVLRGNIGVDVSLDTGF